MSVKSPLKILIVDDIPANIYSLELLLQKEGRVFLTANNGNEALQIVFNNKVDLILLDVQMPDMNGFEVAQILKLNKNTKDIPIIFASATKKGSASILRGLEEGAIDYLSKPLDPEILKAKVSTFLKIQQQKIELLKKNETLEKFALLINNSIDIIGIINRETLVIEEINEAFRKTLGFPLEEVKGKSITAFLKSESIHMVETMLKFSSENIYFETEIITQDSITKWLQWNGVRKNSWWVLNARDVTEKKLADNEIKKLNASLEENLLKLQQTNKEMESFSYSVSHDLRAPVRALIGYSRILREEHFNNVADEPKRLLAVIEKNALRMNNLIDDLLKFSRLGRKEVQKSYTDMDKIVSDVMVDNNFQNNDKISFIVNTILPIQCDAALLTQVWYNLISNAVKYSSKVAKSVIEIGSSENDSEVIYCVKDNGVGFNMVYVNKLFGVFQRLHSNEFEGTGIGLAIVQKIINRHGGSIWAEAKENEGASFYFSLPKG